MVGTDVQTLTGVDCLSRHVLQILVLQISWCVCVGMCVHVRARACVCVCEAFLSLHR